MSVVYLAFSPVVICNVVDYELFDHFENLWKNISFDEICGARTWIRWNVTIGIDMEQAAALLIHSERKAVRIMNLSMSLRSKEVESENGRLLWLRYESRLTTWDWCQRR